MSGGYSHVSPSILKKIWDLLLTWSSSFFGCNHAVVKVTGLPTLTQLSGTLARRLNDLPPKVLN